jgi:transposase-like protein
VAALELQRTIQVSYKTALFMLHRIRFAMDETGGEPLSGTVEVDETYVGGKPRRLSAKQREKLIAEGKEVPQAKRGRGTKKIPVVSAVQRDGKIRRRVIANITGENVGEFLKDTVHGDAAIVTDQLNTYPHATKGFKGGHHSVNHAADEYARTDEASGLRVHTNTAEASHSLLKRGIVGVWHRISAKHLHRYLANADFLWNTRRMSDGDRVLALIQQCEGRRLLYREPVATA